MEDQFKHREFILEILNYIYFKMHTHYKVQK